MDENSNVFHEESYSKNRKSNSKSSFGTKNLPKNQKTSTSTSTKTNSNINSTTKTSTVSRKEKNQRIRSFASSSSSSTDNPNMTLSTNDSNSSSTITQSSLSQLVQDTDSKPVQTLSGGVSLIFAMARRMLVWDDESYRNHWRETSSSSSSIPSSSSSSSSWNTWMDTTNTQPNHLNENHKNLITTTLPNPNSSSSTYAPRWHPYDGISYTNPDFRYESPMMNTLGYANAIRRNSRKKKKASLWRYALRMYHKMKRMELESSEEEREKNIGMGRVEPPLLRQQEHHEAALVACAKLGLWREALAIYTEVALEEEQPPEEEGDGKKEEETVQVSIQSKNGKIPKNLSSSNFDSIRSSSYRKRKNDSTSRTTRRMETGSSDPIRMTSRSHVTYHMIVALVKACVRFRTSNQEEKRLALDTAKDILLSTEKKHGIALESVMINPLAAAYMNMGDEDTAIQLIQSILPNRSSITSSSSLSSSSFIMDMDSEKNFRRSHENKDPNDMEDSTTLNIRDIGTKDRASYNILIQGALSKGNWSSAIGSLKEMTQTGLYPNMRDVNRWYEHLETKRNDDTSASSRRPI